MAHVLQVPLRVLDIDDYQSVGIADKLVLDYGDYTEDYLIPQVFAEFDDGTIQHFLTGFPEGIDFTRRGWQNIFLSNFCKRLAISP